MKQLLMTGLVVAAFAIVPAMSNADWNPKGRELHAWFWGTVNDPTTGEAFFGIIICKVIPGELNPFWPKPNKDGDILTGDEDFGGICDLDCTGPTGSCLINVNHKVDKSIGIDYVVCFDADKDGFYICPFPKVKKTFLYVKTAATDVPSLFVSFEPLSNPVPPVKYQAIAIDP